MEVKRYKNDGGKYVCLGTRYTMYNDIKYRLSFSVSLWDRNEKSRISINDAILSVIPHSLSSNVSFQKAASIPDTAYACLAQLLEHWQRYQISVRYSMN